MQNSKNSLAEACPVESLLELADRAGADWLRAAVEDYLAGVELGQALGMAGAPGRPTARKAYLRRQRDRHLRLAWRAVEGALGSV